MSEVKLYGVCMYRRKPKGKVGPAYKAYLNYLKYCFITNKINDSWVYVI